MYPNANDARRLVADSSEYKLNKFINKVINNIHDAAVDGKIFIEVHEMLPDVLVKDLVAAGYEVQQYTSKMIVPKDSGSEFEIDRAAISFHITPAKISWK